MGSFSRRAQRSCKTSSVKTGKEPYMTFEEILAQARELLQRKGRMSYRALKLQFSLDDEYLAGFKDELVDAERVAADEDGKVLVWVGATSVPSAESRVAVIGRQFPVSLIRQVIAQPEADLYRLLASLQHKEFLYEQPAFPESEYIFKHALTQDVAYGTVLQEQRKLLTSARARRLNNYTKTK